MSIIQYYKILTVSPNAPDELITRTFKKLALKYHPDRNMDRPEWANKAMTTLNIAYTSIMSHRFKTGSINNTQQTEKFNKHDHKSRATGNYYKKKNNNNEFFIKKFAKYRETSKDSLYKFFQYNLNNIIIRENPVNMGIFNRIVHILRSVYHSINNLLKETNDPELVEHFNVFNNMIFNFYKASECLNIIDSYKNRLDVNAYRQYKNGDEALHKAHKEIFYDRHNRGHFKSHIAFSYLMNSIRKFKLTIVGYPESTWIMEAKIKLNYAESLKKYMDLFFTE